MPGEPDQIYVLARRVLLDALEALDDQRAAVVLVGAQAIYLHTGDTDLAVAPFTIDGDVAINPEKLRVDPKLEEALRNAGFQTDEQNVGTWTARHTLGDRHVDVDIRSPRAWLRSPTHPRPPAPPPGRGSSSRTASVRRPSPVDRNGQSPGFQPVLALAGG